MIALGLRGQAPFQLPRKGHIFWAQSQRAPCWHLILGSKSVIDALGFESITKML